MNTKAFLNVCNRIFNFLEDKQANQNQLNIANELTRFHWNQLVAEGFAAYAKSDKAWFLKTRRIYEEALKHGITPEEITKCIQLALKNTWWRTNNAVIHAKGILRNFLTLIREQSNFNAQKKEDLERFLKNG